MTSVTLLYFIIHSFYYRVICDFTLTREGFVVVSHIKTDKNILGQEYFITNMIFSCSDIDINICFKYKKLHYVRSNLHVRNRKYKCII